MFFPLIFTIRLCKSTVLRRRCFEFPAERVSLYSLQIIALKWMCYFRYCCKICTSVDTVLPNEGRFCNNSAIDAFSSKRLSVENKVKLSQLETRQLLNSIVYLQFSVSSYHWVAFISPLLWCHQILLKLEQLIFVDTFVNPLWYLFNRNYDMALRLMKRATAVPSKKAGISYHDEVWGGVLFFLVHVSRWLCLFSL